MPTCARASSCSRTGARCTLARGRESTARRSSACGARRSDLERQLSSAGVRRRITRQHCRPPALLLAFAYPDRIGHRRADGGGRFTLANGRGAAFAAPQPLSRSEFIVAVDLDDRERDARIRLAAPLERADSDGAVRRHASGESIRWRGARASRR